MSRIQRGLFLLGVPLAAAAMLVGVFFWVKSSGDTRPAAIPVYLKTVELTGAPPQRAPFPSDSVVQRKVHHPDHPLTQEELEAKRRLEELLAERQPTHRVVFDSFRRLSGRLEEEHPDYIVFSERYGDSGSMRVPIARDRIVSIEPVPASPVEITRRDVRFHMEFPGKFFYKKPPYTIVTDESFFAIERVVERLGGLYREFSGRFAPLIDSSFRPVDVQLLFFSDEKEYAGYQKKHAEELGDTFGFYSIFQNRLTVFHQRDAEWVKSGRRQISAAEEKYRAQLKSDRARRRLARWKADAETRLIAQAGEATRSVLRHEGAHQLSFAMGVQNPLQAGRAWVTEGVAALCETHPIGLFNRGRMDEPVEMESLSLARLLELDKCSVSEHYTQAWALVYVLMQDDLCDGFFSYLDWVREHPGVPDDPVGELCRFLPVSADSLEARWKSLLATVPEGN